MSFYRWERVLGCLIIAGALSVAAGCTRTKPAVAAAKPPEVSFVHPSIEKVRDYEEYTGRTAASKMDEIRARVTGELKKIFFKDGTEVKAGDPLFEIDPRTFEAALESARATVHQAKGDLERKRILLTRDIELRRKGTISQEDLDNAQADWEVAKGTLELAEANRRTAELNVEFCHINAPIDGKIDRRMIDIGNQVTANATLLTTVRTEDPMYVNFDVDERTVLGLRLRRQKKEIKSARETKSELDVGLANEEGYSLKGFIDYSANGVDTGTGTLRVRLVLDNPDKEPRTLSDGMYVRVRFWIGDPTPSILVPEAALVSDQGIRHLFVLNEHDEVEYRPVQIGLQQGGMRVIKSGVTPKDRVIVSGLQRVRAGIKVAATEQVDKKHPATDVDGKDKTATTAFDGKPKPEPGGAN
jgi:RND family efflux transporter MFP subunit